MFEEPTKRAVSPSAFTLPLTISCLALLLWLPAAAEAAVSLAGVHDFSGDTTLVDPNAPFGERGWAVELVPTVATCRGNLAGERSGALAAKNAGMQVIFRVDYKQANGRQVAVPVNGGQYAQWTSDFNQCLNKLSDITSLFIVGNEPNLDYDVSPITWSQYAAAFNYLYARKAAGSQLLATFNSPFTAPEWMGDMSNALTAVDGWAIHTGAIRGSCTDPRQDCRIDPNWWFDNAFRYYRDVIANIANKGNFRTRPVYITEFNTYAGGSNPQPQDNYIDGWANKAYEEIRNYNDGRGSNDPEVRALCWFTDKVRNGFPRFSLRNIPTALQDMKDAFRNPANRGGGGTTCPTAGLGMPNDRWRLRIWNNRTFSGSPVERRYDAAGSRGFNFNWGSGRPSSCTGNDNYSIRFHRRAYFSASTTYTFTTRADDGVRVYVDGVRIINAWRDQAPTTYTADRHVTAGWHTIRLDYYENGGGATVSLDWSAAGSGGNRARIEAGQSNVPGSLAPNETRAVSIRVTNTGGTTWRAGTNHRLGTLGSNNVTWSGWPCGGYSLSANNARIFLCQDVPPGAGYTFNFTIRAPAGGTGVLGVQMVQDGVEWIPDPHSWTIPVGGGNPYPNCPCNRTDNYCQHGPNTFGCPMTQPGGYCDPNGDGSYSDGDWNRGWFEYNDYCR